MYSHAHSLRCLWRAAALIVALSAAGLLPLTPSAAQSISTPLTKRVGKYTVELRVPPEGLFADQETDVEFHVADASLDDPVQGPPPIVKAAITARVTMPRMAAMPAQAPKIHAEGVPGDYGVVLYFPHGGEYQMDLSIAPPGGTAFAVSYKLPVADATAAKGKTSRAKPYTLEVTSAPNEPEAGQPADLTIFVRSRDTKQPVTDFDTVHERQIHFMVVSADMQHFAHEHPVLGSDGRFTLHYAFPTGGDYHLFADVAPKGAGSQILSQSIHVRGPAGPAAAPAGFTPSVRDTAGGVNVALTDDPARLPVGRTIEITFTVTDSATGQPILDLQPYLGAMAHLMLIHQDGTTFVHSHPDETDPTNGHKGSLTFIARFPKPGFYRGWLQFQRAGKVETATFTWEVRKDKRP